MIDINECDEDEMNAVVLIPIKQRSAIEANAVAEGCILLASTDGHEYPYEEAEFIQHAILKAMSIANPSHEYDCEVLCEKHATVKSLKAKLCGLNMHYA